MTNIDAQNILVDIVLFHNLNDAELMAIRMAEEALEEKFTEDKHKGEEALYKGLPEEAEPMAVLLIGKMPTDCLECGVGDSNGYCYYAEDDADGVTDNWCEGVRPDWCTLRKAIGIIEPNGHVVYLREGEK